MEGVTDPQDQVEPTSGAAQSAVTDFARFVSASSDRLLRTAWLLTSHREHAQDLTQLAFAKTFAAWHRVRHDDAEAYGPSSDGQQLHRLVAPRALARAVHCTST
jgi:hypothetical protein